MLTYRVGFITNKGKPDAFLIQIDEYNNFGQEVVDIVPSSEGPGENQ